MSKSIKVTIPDEVRREAVLSSFSDQELLAELQRRNYLDLVDTEFSFGSVETAIQDFNASLRLLRSAQRDLPDVTDQRAPF